MNPEFFSRPAGYFTLLAGFVVLTGAGLWWQWRQRPAAMAPAASARPATLPQVFTRGGARFVPPPEAKPEAPPFASPTTDSPVAESKPRPASPLRLYAGVAPTAAPRTSAVSAGRLIPCETVVPLESSRLATPLIALVTEDVWDNGLRVVAAGTEVHGRFALDRSRERLAAEGSWTFRPPRDNEARRSFALHAIALERQIEPATGRPGPHDGLAGFPGQLLRPDDHGELKLFASTFLGTAVLALQDTRAVGGLLGEASLPAATARNATLAGTSAVLRDYAQQIREAIARDGFHVRVPAGTPFYLYVTAAPATELHETP